KPRGLWKSSWSPCTCMYMHASRSQGPTSRRELDPECAHYDKSHHAGIDLALPDRIHGDVVGAGRERRAFRIAGVAPAAPVPAARVKRRRIPAGKERTGGCGWGKAQAGIADAIALAAARDLLEHVKPARRLRAALAGVLRQRHDSGDILVDHDLVAERDP